MRCWHEKRLSRGLLLSFFLFAAALLAVMPIPAGATVILDQANTTVSGLGYISSDSQGSSQTFTVGVDGILESVEVLAAAFDSRVGSLATALGPGELRILATSGGIPIGGSGGSVVLASSTLFSRAGGLYTFDLSDAGLIVNVGDVLAIEVIGSGFWGVGADSYAGGSSFFFNAPGAWQSLRGADYYFRTFVENAPIVATIDEPAALFLFAIGLACVGLVGHRR